MHVHVLGTFVLSLHGRPVTSSEWPSRKARDILKVLAGRGAKGIRREALADLLWPDDPDPGSKLSVALSQLKRVLDPGKAYGPDHFVHADRVSVRLEMDHVAVDVADFVVAAQESLAAASHGERRGHRDARGRGGDAYRRVPRGGPGRGLAEPRSATRSSPSVSR